MKYLLLFLLPLTLLSCRKELDNPFLTTSQTTYEVQIISEVNNVMLAYERTDLTWDTIWVNAPGVRIRYNQLPEDNVFRFAGIKQDSGYVTAIGWLNENTAFAVDSSTREEMPNFSLQLQYNL